MKGYLNLQGFGGGMWAVQVCTRNNTNQQDAKEIGKVVRAGIEIKQGVTMELWAAVDLEGRNHGDRYVDKWAAAQRLARDLGESVER